jgi:hypothetical protein
MEEASPRSLNSASDHCWSSIRVMETLSPPEIGRADRLRRAFLGPQGRLTRIMITAKERKKVRQEI